MSNSLRMNKYSFQILLNRFSKKLLLSLLVVLMAIAFLSPRQTLAASADIPQELKRAFLSWPDEWKEGVVDELAAAITNILQDRGGLTDEQLRDILDGIRNRQLNTFSAINPWTHPVKEEYHKQSLLHAVRSYLEFGPPASKARDDFLKQVDTAITAWNNDLLRKYPNETDVINEAATKALTYVDKVSANPLNPAYKRPVEDFGWRIATESWREELAQLYLEGQTDEKKLIKIYVAILNSLSKVKKASYGPVLPKTPELSEAQRAFQQDVANIINWELSRNEEIVQERTEAEMQKIKVEGILTSAIGDDLSGTYSPVSETMTEDFIETSVKTENDSNLPEARYSAKIVHGTSKDRDKEHFRSATTIVGIVTIGFAIVLLLTKLRRRRHSVFMAERSEFEE